METYLLEEHQTDADMGTSPAATLEAINPRDNLKLSSATLASILQFRMPFRADFLVERRLCPDIVPFLPNTMIGSWQLTKLRQTLESILVAAFRGKPSGREWKEDYADSKYQAWYNLNEEWKAP